MTDQKRAERRVSKCFERHDRIGFDNALAENAGNPAIDVMHDKPRRPDVLNDIPEQLRHGRRFAGIAGVSTHAMRLLEGLKDRFFGIPGCDADTHAVFREQPGATRADARAAADNECNVLYGRLGVALGLSHVVSSDAFGGRPASWHRNSGSVITGTYCFTAMTTLPLARPVST